MEVGEGTAIAYSAAGGWAGDTLLSLYSGVAGEPFATYFVFNFSWGAVGALPGGIAGYVFTKPLHPEKVNCP